jgi:hypothetical protein
MFALMMRNPAQLLFLFTTVALAYLVLPPFFFILHTSLVTTAACKPHHHPAFREYHRLPRRRKNATVELDDFFHRQLGRRDSVRHNPLLAR